MKTDIRDNTGNLEFYYRLAFLTDVVCHLALLSSRVEDTDFNDREVASSQIVCHTHD